MIHMIRMTGTAFPRIITNETIFEFMKYQMLRLMAPKWVKSPFGMDVIYT